MNNTEDNTSADALREKILTEFKQVHKLAAQGDYTENCTNVVMSLITSYIKQRELALLDRLENSPSVFISATSGRAMTDNTQAGLKKWCEAFIDGDISAGQFKRAVRIWRKKHELQAKKNGFYMAAGLFGADVSRVEELWDKCNRELEKL